MIDDTLLEMRIHLTTGETLTYWQNDPAEARNITSVLDAPQKLFVGHDLMLSAGGGLTVVRNAFITYIEFLTRLLPKLHYPHSASAVKVISRGEYNALSSAEDQPAPCDFVAVHLVGGGVLYWEVDLDDRSASTLDIAPIVHILLTSHGLLAELPGERGAVVVNPANVTSMRFCPGPAQMPVRVWQVNST